MDCCFCSKFAGVRPHVELDTPILETDEFALFVTLGALVDGWVLIVPKKHGYSMKDYYGTDSFKAFTSEVVDLLRRVYAKPVIMFEHGASAYGSIVACGTNHAHLHVIPFDESLLESMQVKGYFETKPLLTELSVADGQEYLLYCDVSESLNDTKAYYHIIEKPESQFYRKLIAEKLQCPDEYDYKRHPMLERSERTYHTLVSAVK